MWLALEVAVESGAVALVFFKGVGEMLQILGYEMACLVVGLSLARHVIGVIVPIEQGLSCLSQLAEELLLHLLKHVEAYEDIGVELVERLVFHVRYHIAVEGTLIGEVLLFQPLVELRVDAAYVLPQVDKPLLQFALARSALTRVFLGEACKEPFQDGLLLLVKIG